MSDTKISDSPGAVVGLPVSRADGNLKVTGGAKYAAEFDVPGVVFAVLVQSEPAKAKLLKVNTTEAEQSPGVIAVFTGANLSDLHTQKGMPSGIEHPYLSDDINYSGQNIAVVVAESYEQAEHAADLIRPEYERGTPSVELEPNIGAAYTAKNGRMPEAKRGDAEGAFASAAVKIDQIYRTPAEHHNPMEPHATLATWGPDGKCLAYDATQGVFGASSTISHALGLQPSDVRIVDPFVGGGFGCKGMSWPHSTLCAAVARAVGRPVKIAVTRRQMFTSNGHRPETRQAIKLGATADGKLVSIIGDMINETCQTSDFVEPTGSSPWMLYPCQNVHITHRLVKLDVPPGTFQRAPGEASGSFGNETAMDELAYAVGLDPLELRVRNYAEIDGSTGKPWSTKHLRECYEQGAKDFGWSNRSKTIGGMRDGNALVGYGVATATYPANVRESMAKATLNGDGTLLVQCGTQDLGTGTYTILGQIAADGAGVSYQKVRVQIADTTLPESGGSGGSTSASSAGSAVMEAAEGLKAALVDLAVNTPGSPFSGEQASNIRGAEGQLWSSKNPDKKVRYEEILTAANQKSLENEVRSAGRPKDPSPQGHSYHAFGAQFCEVHVDMDTRMLRVARWSAAFAVGRILNAKTLKSQLQGGIVFGIGMGLLEQSLMDPKYGRYLNSNLAEYHVPTNRDVPPIRIIMIDEDDRLASPVGSKGAGEIGITGVAAAIGNAVYHATGKRIRDLPITLDKLL